MKPTSTNRLPTAPAAQPARIHRTGLFLLLALAANGPALAQVGCAPTDPVFMAEGPLSAIEGTAGGGLLITSLGVPIEVTPATVIGTPTRSPLTIAEFADEKPFPGRTQKGFLGATVIASGCVKLREGNPQPEPYALAETVDSDVSENVLLGVVTGPLSAGEFQADGTRVQLLDDSRMPARPMSNAFGFEIDPTTVAPGMNVAIEGYYASEVLHAWSVEIDGARLADANTPQISIQRFGCAGDMELRGGIYLANGGACSLAGGYSLALFDAGTQTAIPFAAGDLDVTNGVAPAAEFCSYRLRPRVTQCPASVTVRLLLNSVPIAEATAP